MLDLIESELWESAFKTAESVAIILGTTTVSPASSLKSLIKIFLFKFSIVPSILLRKQKIYQQVY